MQLFYTQPFQIALAGIRSCVQQLKEDNDTAVVLSLQNNRLMVGCNTYNLGDHKLLSPVHQLTQDYTLYHT